MCAMTPGRITHVLFDFFGTLVDYSAAVGDTYAADFVGPQAAGIRAYLIDPAQAYDIPADQRLDSLADLPARLLL
jgi:putative hydrolase of the HAD superfamily